jgi:hypothetical protein
MYPVEECDVLDKEGLRLFRDKRSEWISWLQGDDPHSIWRQITTILWFDVLFRTVNDLWRHGLDHPSENVGFNHAVLHLFNAGFVTTQVTAIRRLTEPQPKNPTKGVISLRRLVGDIRDSQKLITREVYVACDGLPYDPAPVQLAWATENPGSAGWISTTGPSAWGTSQMAHANFDKLSKCSDPKSRSRTDLIAPDWFDRLDSRLNLCKGIRKFVDKFVAHAAEPSSRTDLTDAQTDVTLERLGQCHKAIYQVAAFVYGPLLWRGTYGAVPTPQYDHLENLEKGWVAKDKLNIAREFWNRNREAIEKWEFESLWLDDRDRSA